MNSPESIQSSPTCTTTSEDSTPSAPTKSENCSETSLPDSGSTPRQVHNPEGVTEPPPAGYRLLYADEAEQRPMEEFGKWYIYMPWPWRRWDVLDSNDPPETINPDWSYAVPVDWVPAKAVPELHAKIAALRAEIAELRRHLNPPVG